MLSRMWSKGNSCALMMDLEVATATMKNRMDVPQKIKNRTTMWSSYSSMRYLPKENENTNFKRYMCPYVYCSVIYNSLDMKATQVSNNRLMDKDVAYIHNGILLKYLKKWDLATCNNMNGPRGYYAK